MKTNSRKKRLIIILRQYKRMTEEDGNTRKN